METRLLTQTSVPAANYDGMMMSRKDHHHHHHHSSTSSATSVSSASASSLVRAMRPHSTPATLMWLEENYEMAQGVCVPRNTLYLHYVDFCSKNGMTPVNAASFGKIIRQQFPQLTTRRLGTRGQSRYHYYGIAIRETSPYYELVYSKKGLQASEDMRKDHLRQIPSGSCQSSAVRGSGGGGGGGGGGGSGGAGGGGGGGKLATRLPEFPSLRDLCLPPGVPEERVATFIMMYRAHCQRLLDTIIRASFDEVQTFLLHYWQGMPGHMIGVVGSNVVVNIVGVCDSILYRSVCSILMSSVMRALPETLIQMIRKFAFELDSWLRPALEDLPENLRAVKMDLARHFCHMLRRQASLNHLFQTIRLALHDPQIHSALLHDWQRQDLPALVKASLQASLAFSANSQHSTGADGDVAGRKRRPPDVPLNQSTVDLMIGLCMEFERLLQEQAPLEAYTEWVESIVDRCVLQYAQRRRLPLRTAIRQFLMIWIAFGSRLLREMTAQAAPGFGTFHLMRIMFDDYFLYLVELLHIDERAGELMRNIQIDIPPEYPDTDYEGFLANVFAGLDVSEMALSTAEHSPDQTSTPHHYPDVVPDETSHLDGSLNEEDSSGGAGSGGEGNGQQQHVIVNEYLPASGETPVVANVPTGDDTNCSSFTYDYSLRVANGYKFAGTGNESSICRGYSYPSNGATSQQLTYYQTSGFADVTLQEYGPYTNNPSTAQYPPVRRGVVDFSEHCSLGYYAEQAGNNYPASATINVAGTGTEYYSYEVTPAASASSVVGTAAPAVAYPDLPDPKLKKMVQQQQPVMEVEVNRNDSATAGISKEPAENASADNSTFPLPSEAYIRS